MDPEFAMRVVRWQRSHGRNHLPWQGTQDPYAVWLSEIMLQQTQVGAVREYFARFMQRFPDVGALAQAPLDEVLGLWSGLGYYSRARNLHRCAREIMDQHGGQFPRSAELLQTLPGIGRSTAGAIAAFCFGERVAILDGNVRRVLARSLAFDADLSKTANERALWDLATGLLPRSALRTSMPAYTQGMMDLGATVCVARNPQCLVCPVADTCGARREGAPEKYPVKTRKLKRSAQSLWLLHLHTADGAVWLQRRPVPGVWAGLYCLPLFDSFEALQAAVPLRHRTRLQDAPAFVHVLTHKDLHLHPVSARVPAGTPLCAQALPAPAQGKGEAGIEQCGEWIAPEQWPQLGLPAPIRRLLQTAVRQSA
ncbi:MAG: A/G-specific adenine glycosylase [Hylemonella sp.]|nr:A/G-specific adenine glycosylase [Hylemonella sp.]